MAASVNSFFQISTATSVSMTTGVPFDVSNPPEMIPLASYGDKFQSISNLGNGSFGSVELAKYKGDKAKLMEVTQAKIDTMMDPLTDAMSNSTGLAAIKTMKKKLPQLIDYMRVKEVRFILAIPSHPCLVQIYDMFIDDISFQLHIVMEPMSQNLYQLMKARKHAQFSVITLRSILSQVLAAIQHIHKYEYFHRDVKPENILVISTQQYYGSKSAIPPHKRNDNYVVKLADYGLARNIHNLKNYTAYVSTRWYRAPEILLRQKWYSRPIDVWAFGVVAAEVANFAPLLPGSNELDQIWRTLKILGSPNEPVSDSVQRKLGLKSPPLGGYWDSARELAGKLGFLFPPSEGVRLKDLLRNPQQKSLAEVIKACLQWDPRARPTATALSNMAYFKSTLAVEAYINPDRASKSLIKEKSGSLKSRLTSPFEFSGNILHKSHNGPVAPVKKLRFDLTPEHIVSPTSTSMKENFLDNDSFAGLDDNGDYFLEDEDGVFNNFSDDNVDIEQFEFVKPLSNGKPPKEYIPEEFNEVQFQDSALMSLEYPGDNGSMLEFDDVCQVYDSETNQATDEREGEYLWDMKGNDDVGLDHNWNLNNVAQGSIFQDDDGSVDADISFGSTKEIAG